MSAATGLRFINDGQTTEGPVEDRAAYQPARYGDRWAPVLIAWATPEEVPDFGVDIAGEAGPVRIQRPNGQMVYITGQVNLDPTKLAGISRGNGRLPVAVIEHELGHLVGLAHVADPAQIMFPRGSGAVSDYQAGDLAGLAALGRGNCAPDV